MTNLTNPERTMIVDIMGHKYAKRTHPNRPYWQIRDRGFLKMGDYNKRRMELLRQFINDFPGAYIWYGGGDRIYKLVDGSWQPSTVDEYTWVIPLDVDVPTLYNFLHEGEWHIYKSISGEPVGLAFKDYDTNVPSEFVRLFLENEFATLLWSVADNDPWYFAVRRV